MRLSTNHSQWKVLGCLTSPVPYQCLLHLQINFLYLSFCLEEPSVVSSHRCPQPCTSLPFPASLLLTLHVPRDTRGLQGCVTESREIYGPT